jgi:hypothetical protein
VIVCTCSTIAVVTDPPHEAEPQHPERRRLSGWERWAIDETGQPIVEFDVEAHAEWCAKWARRA